MRALAMVGAVLAVAMAYQVGSAQGPSWVGAPEYIGPAAVEGWTVSVDRAARTLTVRGWVVNRSDAALTGIRVGIADEDTAEVALPGTLQPGGRAPFVVSLYTGSDWTVSAYVLADVIAPSLYVPASVRP